MSRGSLAKQINELDKDGVSSFLKCMNSDLMSDCESEVFKLKANNIVREWRAHSSSRFSSNMLDFRRLNSFREWRQEIFDQKDKYILFLIHLMLGHSSVAYAHYLELKKGLEEFQLSYSVIWEDEFLKELSIKERPTHQGHARLNALYWLTSSEAKQYLCNEKTNGCLRQEANEVSKQLVGLVCGDEFNGDAGSDIMFELRECNKENDTRRVCISLNLKNISNKDFYIYRSALLLDAFIPPSFNIKPPVECTFKLVNYQPRKFFLKHGEEISNPVILSDVCNFEKAGKYNVEFNGYVQLCSEGEREGCTPSQHIVGSVAIELDECCSF